MRAGLRRLEQSCEEVGVVRRPGTDEEEELVRGLARVAALEQPRREDLDGVEGRAGSEAVGLVECVDELGGELRVTDQQLHRAGASIRQPARDLGARPGSSGTRNE